MSTERSPTLSYARYLVPGLDQLEACYNLLHVSCNMSHVTCGLIPLPPTYSYSGISSQIGQSIRAAGSFAKSPETVD